MKAQQILKNHLKDTLYFSRPDGWDRLTEHLVVHRHLQNLASNRTVSWEEAAESWLTDTFRPLLAAIQRNDVHAAFPDVPIGDIYLEVSDHWHFLRSNSPAATPINAADSYAGRYGKKLRHLASRITGKLRRRPAFERTPQALPREELVREEQHDSQLRKEIWG